MSIAMLAGMCLFTVLNYCGQRFFVFSQQKWKNGEPLAKLG
jgi:hypothetical protein